MLLTRLCPPQLKDKLWASEDAFVIATKLNTGSLETSGIDVSANYAFDIGSYGSLRVDYLATFLHALDKEPLPGLDIIECAGYFASTNASCGTSKPEYRHNIPVTWTTPWGDLTARATWLFVASASAFMPLSDVPSARTQSARSVHASSQS